MQEEVLHIDQIGEYSENLNADMIDYLKCGLTEYFEGFDDYDMMAFQGYNVSTDEIGIIQIMNYIDREDIFFFCSDKQSYNKCSELLADAKTNERALYLYFVTLLSQDAKRMEQFETVITNAEDAALLNFSTTEQYTGFSQSCCR